MVATAPASSPIADKNTRPRTSTVLPHHGHDFSWGGSCDAVLANFVELAFGHSCYGRPVPELYPFLAVQDVPGAVDFYARAFDAVEEDERLIAPDGRQVAVLQIAGHPLGVATEAPELGTPSPETVGATTVRISLHVDDPDAAYAQAVAAGASEVFPVADQPYGMRQGRVVDPFGHHWLIGKRL